MAVITLASSKGGSGKSTIALNLARELQLRGKKVIALDADPQQSLIDEYHLLESSPLFDAELLPEGEDAEAVISSLRGSYDFIIIDSQGVLDKRVISILANTDLAIIPVKPSQKDIYAISTMVDLVKQMKEKSGHPSAAFLVNGAIQNTKLSKDIFEVLTNYELQMFEQAIYQRVSYTEIRDGRCAIDFDHKAKAEIGVIADELQEAFK